MESNSEKIDAINSGTDKKFLILAVIFAAYIVITIPAILNYFKTLNPENFVSVNGKKYTIDDVEKEAPGLAYKVKSEYVKGLGQTFGQFASDKMLELEGKEKNMEPSKVLSEGLVAYEPSQQEIERTYNQYKAQLGNKSLPEVSGDISDFLKNRKEEQHKAGVARKLREKYKVKIELAELTAPRMKVEEKGNPSIGPDKAKVTVIEFSDFECPYCQRSQMVNRQLREKYKDKIRWVFRDFPLPFHKNARFAHEVAGCGHKQGKFWEVFDKLFENTGDLERNNVLFLAEKAGLDKTRLNACLQDSSSSKEVDVDLEDGRKLGVNGTPAFFINGIMLEGAQPIERFVEIIDKELKN